MDRLLAWLEILSAAKEGDSCTLDPSEVTRLRHDLQLTVASFQRGLDLLEQYKNALAASDARCERALELAESFKNLNSQTTAMGHGHLDRIKAARAS